MYFHSKYSSTVTQSVLNQHQNWVFGSRVSKRDPKKIEHAKDVYGGNWRYTENTEALHNIILPPIQKTEAGSEGSYDIDRKIHNNLIQERVRFEDDLLKLVLPVEWQVSYKRNFMGHANGP